MSHVSFRLITVDRGQPYIGTKPRGRLGREGLRTRRGGEMSALGLPSVEAADAQLQLGALGLASSCLLALRLGNLRRYKTNEEQQVVQEGELESRGYRTAARSVNWGTCDDVGPRDYMEDAFHVDQEADHFFVGVYDGHGGSASSAFLRDNLHKSVLSLLRKNKATLNNNGSTEQEVSQKYESLLCEAFCATDSALIDHIAGLGDPECWSGSTATVCLVNSSDIICANVGDSRAVLCRGDKPIELSADHRPTTMNASGRSEIKRVNDAGGWVTQSRVCGILAVSRAFGDYEFKGGRFELLEELKETSDRIAVKADMDKPPVISTPHVATFARTCNDKFVIVATDGLWDTMNSAQAVTFVRSELKRDPSLTMDAIADSLVSRALRCRTQDNVACVVFQLSP
jgi:protein phosphatase 1A